MTWSSTFSRYSVLVNASAMGHLQIWTKTPRAMSFAKLSDSQPVNSPTPSPTQTETHRFMTRKPKRSPCRKALRSLTACSWIHSGGALTCQHIWAALVHHRHCVGRPAKCCSAQIPPHSCLCPGLVLPAFLTVSATRIKNELLLSPSTRAGARRWC